MNAHPGFVQISLLAIITFCQPSCGKRYDDRRRTVKYEVMGHIVGMATLRYTPRSSDTTVSLPWTKTVSLDNSIHFVEVGVGGINGPTGDDIVIKFFLGNTEIKSDTFPIPANTAFGVIGSSPF